MPEAGVPYRRDESEAHKLDRNYSELLQELRVAETGVQVLFAFLLAIAFQQRFSTIDTFQRVVYLVTLTSAALAVAALIAPVALHRALFRRGLKADLVNMTARLAAVGLAFLAIAMLGAVLLVFDFVTYRAIAIAVTIVLAGVFGGLWLVLPAAVRARDARARAGAIGSST